MSENRINVYRCKYGHRTITKDIDTGVTPMFIDCKSEGCEEMASSSGYQCDQSLQHTHEWYKPESLEGLHHLEKEHVQLGNWPTKHHA